MNHGVATLSRIARLALAKLARTESAELFDHIAESFRELSPDICAAALNAATAQRAADDYRATLAAALGAPDSDPASPMMEQVPDKLTQDATGPAETHTMEEACEMAFSQYADGRAAAGRCALEYAEFRGFWRVAVKLRLSADEMQERLRLAESRLCPL